jgi:hypothetical protein
VELVGSGHLGQLCGHLGFSINTVVVVASDTAFVWFILIGRSSETGNGSGSAGLQLNWSKYLHGSALIVPSARATIYAKLPA